MDAIYAVGCVGWGLILIASMIWPFLLIRANRQDAADKARDKFMADIQSSAREQGFEVLMQPPHAVGVRVIDASKFQTHRGK